MRTPLAAAILLGFCLAAALRADDPARDMAELLPRATAALERDAASGEATALAAELMTQYMRDEQYAEIEALLTQYPALMRGRYPQSGVVITLAGISAHRLDRLQLTGQRMGLRILLYPEHYPRPHFSPAGFIRAHEPSLGDSWIRSAIESGYLDDKIDFIAESQPISAGIPEHSGVLHDWNRYASQQLLAHLEADAATLSDFERGQAYSALCYMADAEREAEARATYGRQAIAYFARLPLAHAQGVEARLQIAAVYAGLGDLDGAERTCRALMVATPDAEVRENARLHLAQLYMAADDWPAAERHLWLLIRQPPVTQAEASALITLGQHDWRQERYRAAATHFDAYCRAFPDGPLAGKAALLVGQALIREKDYPAAITALQRVPDHSDDPDILAEASYWLGDSQRNLRDLAAAHATLTALAAAYPDSKWAKFARALLVGDEFAAYH